MCVSSVRSGRSICWTQQSSRLGRCGAGSSFGGGHPPRAGGFPAHSWRVMSNARVRLPIDSAAQHGVHVKVHIAQHITTCRSEAARASSGLSHRSTMENGDLRRMLLAILAALQSSIANETSHPSRTRLPRKPGRVRTLATVGLERTGNRAGQQPTTRHTQRHRTAGRACTLCALKRWRLEGHGRAGNSRPVGTVASTEDRRRTGGEHGDHKVVRPTRIRAQGSR